MLGRDLSGLVDELPRRIGKDGGEAAFADEVEQVPSNGVHKCTQRWRGHHARGTPPCDSRNTKRCWNRFQLCIQIFTRRNTSRAFAVPAKKAPRRDPPTPAPRLHPSKTPAAAPACRRTRR